MQNFNREIGNYYFEKNNMRIESYLFITQFDRFFKTQEKQLSSKSEESSIVPNFLAKRLLAKFLSIVKIILPGKLLILAFLQDQFRQESRRSIVQISFSRHGVPRLIETLAGGSSSSHIDALRSRTNKKLIQKSIFRRTNKPQVISVLKIEHLPASNQGQIWSPKRAAGGLAQKCGKGV